MTRPRACSSRWPPGGSARHTPARRRGTQQLCRRTAWASRDACQAATALQAAKVAYRHHEVIHFGARVQACVRPGGCADHIVCNVVAEGRSCGGHHALGCGKRSCWRSSLFATRLQDVLGEGEGKLCKGWLFPSGGNHALLASTERWSSLHTFSRTSRPTLSWPMCLPNGAHASIGSAD